MTILVKHFYVYILVKLNIYIYVKSFFWIQDVQWALGVCMWDVVSTTELIVILVEKTVTGNN